MKKQTPPYNEIVAMQGDDNMFLASIRGASNIATFEKSYKAFCKQEELIEAVNKDIRAWLSNFHEYIFYSISSEFDYDEEDDMDDSGMADHVMHVKILIQFDYMVTDTEKDSIHESSEIFYVYPEPSKR